jgi:U3 small nucleolar RNA-associated protein 12
LIRFNADSTYLACQAAGKSIEFYRVNDVEKINKKLRNRKRKEEEKRKQAGSADDEEITIELTAREEFSVKGILRTPHKIQSFCFPSNAETKEFLVASVDNSIELYQQGDKNYEKLSSLESPGHRADIRSLALSSADEMLLSTSRDLVKVWNVNTRTCIRTIESGYGICGLFVPGDRHVVIGTKTGKIEIYDLQSARCLEVVDAHAGPVWSLTLKPDQTGFLSGSSDKTLKMWDFELVNDAENKGNKRLTINSSQTVEMSAEVLCAKFSRDGKYVAVSLLDSTVKIFFTDSMKFYLSLFGHKLPVNSLDISDDNALIITGSADKDIKIWGMDFGDCHKSIFAHDDAVTQVIFVPQTHYFFSCGKDGLVKYWDGDKWELIHTLEGHHDKVWAMTLSSQGDMLFTGAADRSIRLWERTNEQMVLDSEREQEREEMWDATLEDEDRYQKEEKEEVGKASVQTLESVKSAEKLMEALAIASKELQNAKDYQQALIEAEKRMSKEEIAKLKAQNQPLLAPPVPHEDLKGQSPSEYVLGVVRSIRSAELEEALLMLTFTQVTDLLRFLNEWVIVGKHIELCARCTFFLVKTHNSQISSTKSLLDTLHSLKENTRKQLQKVKDVIGFNKAAMNHLKRDLESSISTDIFDSAAKFEEVQKRKKQKTGHNYWE